MAKKEFKEEISIHCEYCSKTFYTTDNSRRFCSRSCSGHGLVPVNKKAREIKHCRNCDKTMFVIASEMESKHYCSQRCMRIWRKANKPENEDRETYSRRWYRENRDRAVASRTKWTKNNPDYFKDYYKNNKQKKRNKQLLNNYGITLEQYYHMLNEQDGQCAICGDSEYGAGGKMLHVDHDHASGTVRGLLCNHCNTGLGAFMDNPDSLRHAAEYVERTRVTNNALSSIAKHDAPCQTAP